MHLSDAALASEAINEALRLDPGSVAGRCLQALMMLRGGGAGGAAKALKVLAQAGDAEGEQLAPWVNYCLFLAHKAKGDVAVATEHLQKEVEAQPGSKFLTGFLS